MALFKCKMCGGSLKIDPELTVIECEYCGTQQTLPRLDNDKRANMYDRANHFRRNNEFDKAMAIYEQILDEDSTDAEAYWSIVLCRYGIEYVEDPASHKRIPTVNRAQFTSIFDDDNYKSALEHSDALQRVVYENEAKAINEIQKGILAISQKEEPFDVFICYKETDRDGRRTLDSVLAQDLYNQLTKEGFKVFFSRITLEDKLGVAYEPYIFAALNSASVMVVLGTKKEHFDAVWVKNEWSRYLSLIKQGKKKLLIPAYKDMDPYDLPEEFAHLQAQDMTKIGFMQDLVHGIEKTVNATKEKSGAKSSSGTAALLKKASAYLEAGEIFRAKAFFDQILNIEPDNAEAYIGKLLLDLNLQTKEALLTETRPFEKNEYYQKALAFANDEFRKELENYVESANKERIYLTSKQGIFDEAPAGTLRRIARDLSSIEGYKDADKIRDRCLKMAEEAEKAEKARKEAEKARQKAKKAKTIKLIIGILIFIALVAAAAIAMYIFTPSEAGYEYSEGGITYVSNGDGTCYIKDVDTKETKIVIPKKTVKRDIVTSIGDSAFFGCISLSSVDIPDSVTSIGRAAFSGCTNLVSIELFDGVTSIGEAAFASCASLESIAIPDNVMCVEDRVFYNCERLKRIDIPDGVESIGFAAFYGCTSLTSVVIPDGVTSIGGSAFQNCTGITSIVIPDSVTSIGSYAFSNCDGLTSITIPDSVTSIGDYAFRACSGLESVVIGDSVTDIGIFAFYNCTSLDSIKYRGTESQWDAISKGSGWKFNTGNYTITYNYNDK